MLIGMRNVNSRLAYSTCVYAFMQAAGQSENPQVVIKNQKGKYHISAKSYSSIIRGTCFRGSGTIIEGITYCGHGEARQHCDK